MEYNYGTLLLIFYKYYGFLLCKIIMIDYIVLLLWTIYLLLLWIIILCYYYGLL